MAYTDSFTYSAGNLAGNGSWLTATGATGCVVGSSTEANMVQGGASAAWSSNYHNQTYASAHYAKVKTIFNGDSTARAGGPAIRCQTGENTCYWAAADSGGNVYVGETINGSTSEWSGGDPIPSGPHISNGQTLEIAVDATTTTTIYVKVNGSTIATFTSKTATPNSGTTGKAGVSMYGAGTYSLDDWEGGDVASGLSIPVAAYYQQMLRRR